jgi:hypothetical protein
MTISPSLTPGALETRTPLGRILLVCGPDCSTELVADHLQAALAGGNSLVVVFVEQPSASTARLLDVLTSTLSRTVFERLLATGGPWNLTLPDTYVVAVLTALHIVVADERRRHGRRPAGRGPSNSLLRLFTTPNALSKEATK